MGFREGNLWKGLLIFTYLSMTRWLFVIAFKIRILLPQRGLLYSLSGPEKPGATPGRAALSKAHLTHYTMRKIIPFALLIILFTGCKEYAYYQSPLHTNTHPYKTIPLKSEERAVATYASGVLTAGGANDKYRDGYIGALGSGYRAHNFGRFQGFYGISGSWGSYKVDSIHNSRDSRNRYVASTVNDSLINKAAGRKSWGSIGGFAGINFVIPFRKGGEWRMLGAEMSWTHELGSYYDFRRKLPDTAANLIDRSRNFLTLALSTELVGSLKNGSISYKLAGGGSFRKMPGYAHDGTPMDYTSGFMSQTLAVTVNRVTLFSEWKIGSYSMGIHLGANVRLSK